MVLGLDRGNVGDGKSFSTDCIKLRELGACFFRMCSEKLLYGSSGRKVFARHELGASHKASVQAWHTSTLPETMATAANAPSSTDCASNQKIHVCTFIAQASTLKLQKSTCHFKVIAILLIAVTFFVTLYLRVCCLATFKAMVIVVFIEFSFVNWGGQSCRCTVLVCISSSIIIAKIWLWQIEVATKFLSIVALPKACFFSQFLWNPFIADEISWWHTGAVTVTGETHHLLGGSHTVCIAALVTKLL